MKLWNYEHIKVRSCFFYKIRRHAFCELFCSQLKFWDTENDCTRRDAKLFPWNSESGDVLKRDSQTVHLEKYKRWPKTAIGSLETLCFFWGGVFNSTPHRKLASTTRGHLAWSCHPLCLTVRHSSMVDFIQTWNMLPGCASNHGQHGCKLERFQCFLKIIFEIFWFPALLTLVYFSAWKSSIASQ